MPPTEAQKRAKAKYASRPEIREKNNAYMREYMRTYMKKLREKAKAFDELQASKKDEGTSTETTESSSESTL